MSNYLKQLKESAKLRTQARRPPALKEKDKENVANLGRPGDR